MRPGSYSRPEQALEVLAGDADQGLGDDPQEEYEDALEILPTICGTVDDSNSETSQVTLRLGQIEGCMAAFQGKLEAQETHIQTIQDTLWRRIQQRLDQLELNCNANVGEAVAAGIEEIREAELAAGAELKDMVEAAVKRCDGDMRALQGEHAKSDRALKLQLHAVLEQARDMRVWREQHNIRLLEMQAALTAVEKRSKSALARTERLCEASVDSVRRGAAASLATEARRLEGLLTGHATRFAEEAAVPRLGTEQDMVVPLDEVEGFRLPSPPSEITSLQSSPPVHSSFVTWQRPHHVYSSAFNTSQRSEGVTEPPSPDSIRAAVTTLESELLQVMDLEALQSAVHSDGKTGQGVPDDRSAPTFFEGLSRAQQGLADIIQILPQEPAETVQEPSATAVLVSLQAEDTRQLPAVYAADSAASTTENRGSRACDELAETECAEEAGAALFWQAAIADVEMSSQAQCWDTPEGAAGAPACPEAADLEHAPEVSTEEQADVPRSASRAPSEQTDSPDSAQATLQQTPARALPAVEIGTCSALSEEGSECVVPHHIGDPEAYNIGNVEAELSALRAVACGSIPTHAAGIGAASTPGSCSTRHHSRSRSVPRAKLSRRQKTLQKPRASPLRRDLDADILAALLALQMAVSNHSAAILQLKQASQPQSCCSLPTSPTQLRGLLTAHLDVAWSGEGSQGAPSGSPSRPTADSKKHADPGALAERKEQGLPHQPSLAAATDGSSGSIDSVGRPSQAEQLQLRHATKTVSNRLPSAAAGAQRRPPSTPSTSSRPQERPGAKQGAKHDPRSFNTVLQSWHKERRLQAGASRK